MPSAIFLYNNGNSIEKYEVDHFMSKKNSLSSYTFVGGGKPLKVEGKLCSYPSEFGGEYSFTLPDFPGKVLFETDEEIKVYHDNNKKKYLKANRPGETYIIRLIFTNKFIHNIVQLVFLYDFRMIPLDLPQKIKEKDMTLQYCIPSYIH